MSLFYCLALVFLGVNLSTAQAVSKKQYQNSTRIYIKEKGLSIVPPQDWEVSSTIQGLSLFMQAPPLNNKKGYRPTIQILTFKDGIPIDTYTISSFRDTLMNKFSDAKSGLKNFKINNFSMVELAKNQKGILYYSEFSLDKKMMQAHLLISSNTLHHLLTYTDIANQFRQNNKNPNLDAAWQSMISARLPTPAPSRFLKLYIFVGIIGVFALFIGIFIISRFILGKKEVADMTREAQADDDDELTLEPTMLNSQFENTLISANKEGKNAKQDDDKDPFSAA